MQVTPTATSNPNRPVARHQWRQQYETDRPSNDQIIDAICLTMEPSGLAQSQVARIAAASVPLVKAFMRGYAAMGCGPEESLYNALDTIASYLPYRDPEEDTIVPPPGTGDPAAYQESWRAQAVDDFVTQVRIAYMPLASRPEARPAPRR